MDSSVKMEKNCKICNSTKRIMETLPCSKDNKKLIKKIFSCTNVRVTPVDGAISPVCEECRELIDSFDENAKPIFRDFVIKAEINVGNINYDPLCEASSPVEQPPIVEPGVSIHSLPCPLVNTKTTKRDREKRRKRHDSMQTESLNDTKPRLAKKRKIEIDDEKGPEGTNTEKNENDSEWEWPLSDSDEKIEGKNDIEKPKKKCGRPKLNSGLHEKCEICGKIVKRLREHLRRHKQKNHLKCPHCERTFSTRFSLNYHIRTHTGERPYKCELCGNSYMSPSHLAMHMNTHSSEQKYQCHICSKRFNQSFKLTQHLKTHTGIKPHNCDVCGKSFLRRHNMNIHMKRHMGEKNFICSICSKRFVIIYALDRHMRAHEKYDSTQNALLLDEKASKCDVCGKAFAKDKYMKAHKKRHFDERFQGRDRRLVKEPEDSDKEEFICNICSKRFIVIEAYNKHMEGHERYEVSQMALLLDEKAFKCDLCEKGFTKDKYLKAHKKRHFENKLPDNQPNSSNQVDFDV